MRIVKLVTTLKVIALWVSLPLLTPWATLHAADFIQLTSDGTLKRDPRFVDEGNDLVYCYDETPDLIRMMRMNMDDRKPKAVFEDSGNKHQLEPFYSPDKRYIVFTECTGNLTARLVIRDLEKKADVAITHSGRGGTRSPCFSPASNLVVYAFAETGPNNFGPSNLTVATKGKSRIRKGLAIGRHLRPMATD